MLQRKIEINWDNNSELLAALESLAVRSDFQIDLLGTTFGVRPVNGCADLPLVQAIAPILNNALNQTWVSEQVIAKRISGSVKTLQNLRWRGTGPPFGMPYGQTSRAVRSEEHTSELQSLMRISYAVFCLKKKNNIYTRLLSVYLSRL